MTLNKGVSIGLVFLGMSSSSALAQGQVYFIATDFLNARSSNTVSGNNVIGQFSLNDEVVVLDETDSSSELVKVRVIQSVSISRGTVAFASKKYLSENFVRNERNKYFVVQNIATEKTRVYERCFETPYCAHKLILETDMIVGRPEVGTKSDRYAYTTWLGHSKISEWIKFYQDGAEHYPPWYSEGQDVKSIPSPTTNGVSNILASRNWLTGENGESTVYGAFGWYAAKVIPADDKTGMNFQWMHGTIGWGVDGSAPIKLTRGFLMNLFSNPASAGCTRLENRAIAFLRHTLAVGTDIYRIYAMENIRRNGLERYRNQETFSWKYLLLADGAQKRNGLTADEESLFQNRVEVSRKNFIERGAYVVDQMPTIAPLNYEESATSGRSGDRYRIGSSSFRGYFLVDEGRLYDYQHPKVPSNPSPIRVSGFSGFKDSVPRFLEARK